MNETQRDPLTRPQPKNLQRPGARIRATASGIERTRGRGRAASRGRREAPQRRGGVGLGMVGIAARMLHAAHGAQDTHAALGHHLKALTKPSGRVRGVWRGGRQGRRPFQALVDGRRARAANLNGAHSGARREPQRAGRCGASPQRVPTTWRLASEDSLCVVERCSRCFVTGASKGLQEDLSSPSKYDFVTAEIRTQLRLLLTIAPQAREIPQRGPPC